MKPRRRMNFDDVMSFIPFSWFSFKITQNSTLTTLNISVWKRSSQIFSVHIQIIFIFYSLKTKYNIKITVLVRIDGPNLVVLHILQWSVVVTHFLEIIRVFSIGLQNPEPYASKLKKLRSHIITFHNLSLETSHLRSIFLFWDIKICKHHHVSVILMGFYIDSWMKQKS